MNFMCLSSYSTALFETCDGARHTTVATYFIDPTPDAHDIGVLCVRTAYSATTNTAMAINAGTGTRTDPVSNHRHQGSANTLRSNEAGASGAFHCCNAFFNSSSFML